MNANVTIEPPKASGREIIVNICNQLDTCSWLFGAVVIPGRSQRDTNYPRKFSRRVWGLYSGYVDCSMRLLTN